MCFINKSLWQSVVSKFNIRARDMIYFTFDLQTVIYCSTNRYYTADLFFNVDIPGFISGLRCRLLQGPLLRNENTNNNSFQFKSSIFALLFRF